MFFRVFNVFPGHPICHTLIVLDGDWNQPFLRNLQKHRKNKKQVGIIEMSQHHPFLDIKNIAVIILSYLLGIIKQQKHC